MHFLITAGGTREYIDPVRFISNASSGKMGYCLAEAALKAGHTVTLISAPTNLKTPKKANLIQVTSSSEMFSAVKKTFKDCDCLIMAAAVSDYTVAKKSTVKIKKNDKQLTLHLKPTTDILKWAGKNKKGRFIVGFALEDRAVRKNAEKKLVEKHLDMIIANRPTAIGAEQSSVEIKAAGNDWLKIKTAGKAAIAAKIIKLINAATSQVKHS